MTDGGITDARYPPGSSSTETSTGILSPSAFVMLASMRDCRSSASSMDRCDATKNAGETFDGLPNVGVVTNVAVTGFSTSLLTVSAAADETDDSSDEDANDDSEPDSPTDSDDAATVEEDDSPEEGADDDSTADDWRDSTDDALDDDSSDETTDDDDSPDDVTPDSAAAWDDVGSEVDSDAIESLSNDDSDDALSGASITEPSSSCTSAARCVMATDTETQSPVRTKAETRR